MSLSYLQSLIKRKILNGSFIDEKISKYLLRIDSKVVNKTISELAIEIGVSETSIYKYVKKLGFNGFQDFKIGVASNLHREEKNSSISVLTDIKASDSPLTFAKKIIQYNIDLLSDFSSFLDATKLQKALDLLYQVNVLHFFGQGGSSSLAFDAYHKFLRSKYRANYIFDYHHQLSYATKLGNQDLAMIFSHSGTTRETIEVAKVLRQQNVKVIAFTGNPNSELVTLSDVSFILYTEEAAMGSESMTSRILYSTLTDILFLNLMYHDESANKEATKKIRTALLITKKDNKRHEN